MSIWSNTTVTEKGYALQAKLLSTKPLVITKVVAGSGRVPAGQLIKQTAVSEEKQTLSVEALSYDANGNAIIKVSLNNKNLTSGYTCNQVGIYASDPDEGEILYAISQEASSGEDIPSITEQPNGYFCSWVFTLTFSNSSSISVTIDPANALTKGSADMLYASKSTLQEYQRQVETKFFEFDEAKAPVEHSHKLSEIESGENNIVSDESAAICCEGTTISSDYSVAIACSFSYTEDENGEIEEVFPTEITGFRNVAMSSVNTKMKGYNSVAAACEDVEFDESANCAFGTGQNLTLKGWLPFCSGIYNTANGYQFVAGKHNKEITGLTNANEQTADSAVFMIGHGTATAPANAFRVSSAGKCYGSAAFVGSGADFPEFEEWADGNPENEDRRGLFVALDGDKIVLASSEKDHIIGVVSAMGAFIANGASENWHGMYLKDVFGENLTHQVEVPEETIKKKVIEKDEEGNEFVKMITKVIPAHTVTQFVVNPEYNPDEEYIGREFRKEWAPVGKLGQVIVVDDGTCTVGGYCKPSANGIGTAGEYGYYVRKRIDSTHIKVEISPGAFNK